MSDAPRDAPSVADILAEWYHVPALLSAMGFMLWVRLQSYGQFIVDGKVVFSGNDAWYHLREVQYTVRHWPTTMPFDPWTHFPFGTSAGQFGTLYDQLVATAALLVGLGGPSDPLVAKTLLVAPAVFGALAAIPVFLIGRRIAGRGAGLFGVAVLALLPGTFLQRTMVGFADHNGAEPFFMGMGVVAILAAFTVADRERPVWELVEARDFEQLRRPTVWAVAAGVGAALYMWTWPPGVLLVGILSVYVILKLTSDYVHGRSPDHGAFAAVVALGTTAVLMVVPLTRLTFGSSTDYTLLQVFVPLAGAGAAAALAALARVWDERNLPTNGYPAAVGGIVLLGIAFLAVALPSVLNNISNNLLAIVGFSTTAQIRTIAEAQPYLAPSSLRQLGFVGPSGNVNRVGRLMADYGFTLFTGVAAAIWLLVKPLVRTGDTRETGYAVGGLILIAIIYLVPGPFAAIGDAFGVVGEVVGLAIVGALIVGATLLVRYDADDLFVIVWAAFITSAAFTQVRFNYYLALVVAVLNAYLLGQVLSYLDLTSIRTTIEDIDGYQVLVVLAVVMLVVTPGLIVPMQVRSTGNPQLDQSTTAWEAGSRAGPGGYTGWQGSLQWMATNTPAEGNYGGAGNAEKLDYYGRYQRTDDFQYPEGAYGVMSWWDYGHWITVTGERIPNANPFQQGSTAAANYLLAPNASQARQVLASQSTEGEQTRYVMVDWQMATPGSKFAAPTIFYNAEKNVSTGDFYRRIYGVSQQGGQQRFTSNFLHRKQRFYDSQMTRLYYYHGSAQEPEPVVVDWEVRRVRTRGGGTTTIRTAPGGDAKLVRQFQTMQAARKYVRNDSTSQIGGIGGFPAERVPALEHYRLVQASNTSAMDQPQYLRILRGAYRTTRVPPEFLKPDPASYVKTFERVPGATLRGSNALPNATVSVEVEMRVPSQNTTFTYTQETTANADGEFTMTLPYATTGYDEYGPAEGYTNASVRATGPYNVSGGAMFVGRNVTSAGGQVHVPEGDVVGAEDGVVRVELNRTTQPIFSGNDSAVQVDGENASDVGAPSSAALGLDRNGDTTGDGTGASESGPAGGGDAPVEGASTSLLAALAPVAPRARRA
ncbi:MAG: oligosaccharyl transferase, archaeosortase A system-associated [Haloferacaceae archaeon]